MNHESIMVSRRLITGSGAVALLLVMSSCTTTPKLADLPSIPEYGEEPLVCRNPGTVGISIEGIAAIGLPRNAQGRGAAQARASITAAEISGVLELMLKDMGCSVFRQDQEYITRDMRLTIRRVLKPAIRNVRLLQARDGVYHDLWFGVVALDPKTGEQEAASFGAWGRSLLSHHDALLNAARNLATVEAFRDMLDQPGGVRE